MITSSLVRLGQSGLKVSKIILGCMSYGNKSWGEWILGEKEGIEHIMAAYAAGINVRTPHPVLNNGDSRLVRA